jgi:predicted aspartyl protease
MTVCLLLLLTSHVQAAAAQNPSAKLRELYRNKQYFELRETVRAQRPDRSAELFFYRGAVSNKFNQPLSSIAFLNNYLKRAKETKDPELLIECYEMLADNYLKTYQYRRAAEAYKTLATRFARRISAEDKADYENAIELWGALGRAPRQTAVFKESSTVKRDREGRIPIEINDQRVAFIFDTGANLSVITSSLAVKLKLRVIDASIDVKAIAGNTVKARLAVARKTQIGNAIIQHAVFLVFDDRDLYVSEADFQINGLIGFPVIEALREVTFVRSTGELFIPATPSHSSQRNMCFDGLSPLVAGWFKGRRLTFALDTGANTSVLYPPFYRAYEDEIKAAYAPHTERMRGVGGHKEIRGYLAKNVVLEVSGRETRFAQIPILIEHTTDTSRHFYGNLGQDLIAQFERMTLNFEAMSIVFE